MKVSRGEEGTIAEMSEVEYLDFMEWMRERSKGRVQLREGEDRLIGGVVNSEEDFHSWVARQVEKLGIAVSRLEGDEGLAGTNTIFQLHNEWMSKLEVRLEAIEGDELVEEGPAWKAMVERVRLLEHQLDQHLKWASTHSHPHDHAEAKQPLSSSISGDSTKTVRETLAMQRGAAKALVNAEARVRNYMTNSFSEATINGVVKAMRGRQ